MAFCRSNKVDLSKLNAPSAFSRASYRNIKSYFTSIELRKSQIKESEYLTQESSLRIYYSSWFVEYPLHPIACCFPHLRCSRRFFIFPIQHLRCSSRHHSHHLTIGSYVSVRSSRYEARGKFGEHKTRATLASWVLSKLPKCFISRWTHSWRMNQLFYNIFNPKENFFLEGFVCWRHERAQ